MAPGNRLVVLLPCLLLLLDNPHNFLSLDLRLELADCRVLIKGKHVDRLNMERWGKEKKINRKRMRMRSKKSKKLKKLM